MTPALLGALCAAVGVAAGLLAADLLRRSLGETGTVIFAVACVGVGLVGLGSLRLASIQ